MRTIWAAAAVATFCAALLLVTSSRLPIVWDEGNTLLRAEQIGREPTKNTWPYTTVREGHPPLAGLVVALGTRLAPRSLAPLEQARLGPILLFSLAVGAMFYRLQRDYESWPVSLLAVGALLTMPRLFAHAHFATLDGPLTACWLLAWATFAPACRAWPWILPFGLALGLTLSAKFSGWLAPVPFFAWAILYRDRRALAAIGLGVSIALVVFVALNPPLWNDPVAGLRTFFDLNLHRAARPEHNISTQFFGRMYNLDFPLPWYNTLAWTAITVSPMPLLVGIYGIVWTLRQWRDDPGATLLFLQWATLIIVRALPGTPPHDAERLILPSFAFFAGLIGVGIGRGLYRYTLRSSEKIIAQGWAKVMMALALGAATFDSIGYFPHGLSYYNRLIGGVRGAVGWGMEPTYYWDSLDRQVLTWLDEHTAGHEKVAFAAASPENLQLLKRWGLLRSVPSDPGQFRWYVVQRRPSAWQAWDRWLIEHEEPALERSFAGVPLLDVYSYEQYERARAAAK